MSWLEALILGILQGLTEFLPVSSSGHIEIGKAFMHIPKTGITFTVVVHLATVLSTILVFWREIVQITGGTFKFKWNEETQYVAKIAISMIPAVIVGLLLEDAIDTFFEGNLLYVGCLLFFTALLLAFTYYAKPRESGLRYLDAIVMGISQAVAILPGISRSGATIATALLLGVKKEDAARFSFLMVIPLIIAANAKKLLSYLSDDAANTTETVSGQIAENAQAIAQTVTDEPVVGIAALTIGFIAAFVTGWVACTWMLNIVKRGKLIWFALYCALAGVVSLAFALH